MKNLRAFQRSQILRQFKWNFSPKMDYLFFSSAGGRFYYAQHA
jgi:hypothetical protein